MGRERWTRHAPCLRGRAMKHASSSAVLLAASISLLVSNPLAHGGTYRGPGDTVPGGGGGGGGSAPTAPGGVGTPTGGGGGGGTGAPTQPGVPTGGSGGTRGAVPTAPPT